MLSIFAITVLWSLAGMISGLISIIYNIGLEDKITSCNTYRIGRELRIQHERALRDAEAVAREASLQVVEAIKALETEVSKSIPKRISDRKDWAIKELSQLNEEELQSVSQGVSTLEEVPGVRIVLFSGRSYSFNDWQALCTYYPQLEKKVAPNYPMKPVEVDSFYDTTRQE
jgi:hypothetical protein